MVTYALAALYLAGAAYTANEIRSFVDFRCVDETIAWALVSLLWPVVLLLAFDDDR